MAALIAKVTYWMPLNFHRTFFLDRSRNSWKLTNANAVCVSTWGDGLATHVVWLATIRRARLPLWSSL